MRSRRARRCPGSRDSQRGRLVRKNPIPQLVDRPSVRVRRCAPPPDRPAPAARPLDPGRAARGCAPTPLVLRHDRRPASDREPPAPPSTPATTPLRSRRATSAPPPLPCTPDRSSAACDPHLACLLPSPEPPLAENCPSFHRLTSGVHSINPNSPNALRAHQNTLSEPRIPDRNAPPTAGRGGRRSASHRPARQQPPNRTPNRRRSALLPRLTPPEVARARPLNPRPVPDAEPRPQVERRTASLPNRAPPAPEGEWVALQPLAVSTTSASSAPRGTDSTRASSSFAYP